MTKSHHKGPEHLDPYRNAQRLAFAPLTFQAALIARDRGVLAAVEDAGPQGISAKDTVLRTGVSYYAARVLLEACLSLDLVSEEAGRYSIEATGLLVLHDPITRVNMDFTNDVCYQGAFMLDESLRTGKPKGLSVFGPWPTIYEGLTHLPEPALKTWLDFDHNYSNDAFPAALPLVFARKPKRMLDVGGNTGRWALACTAYDKAVELTLLDHPGQLALARANADAAGVGPRVQGVAMDLLDHSKPFPTGFDAVWMSQFLDCFGETDIVQLLKRGRAALGPEGRLYILETYWDRQPHPAARDAVIGTSLYFACMANGNSRMYRQDDMVECVEAAGLKVEDERALGFHTLLVCKKA